MEEKKNNQKRKSILLAIVEYVNKKREELALSDQEILSQIDEGEDFQQFITNRKRTDKEKKPKELLTGEELEAAKRELWAYLDDPEHIDTRYLDSLRYPKRKVK